MNAILSIYFPSLSRLVFSKILLSNKSCYPCFIGRLSFSTFFRKAAAIAEVRNLKLPHQPLHHEIAPILPMFLNVCHPTYQQLLS